MGELERHLDGLRGEGQAHSSGQFALDVRKAVEKLQAFFPQIDYYEYWVQFAVASGGEGLQLDPMEIRFRAAAPELEELRSLFTRAEIGYRYLQLGVIGALCSGAGSVTLETDRYTVEFTRDRHVIRVERRGPPGKIRLSADIERKAVPDFPYLRWEHPVRVQCRPFMPGNDLAPARVFVVAHGLRLDSPYRVPELPPQTDVTLQYREDAAFDLALRKLNLPPAPPAGDVLRELMRIGPSALPLPAAEWVVSYSVWQGDEETARRLLREAPNPPPGAYPLRAAWLEWRRLLLREGDASGEWQAVIASLKQPGGLFHWKQSLEAGCLRTGFGQWLAECFLELPDPVAVHFYRESLRLRFRRNATFSPEFVSALYAARRDWDIVSFLLARHFLQRPIGLVPIQEAYFVLDDLSYAVKSKSAPPAARPFFERTLDELEEHLSKR